MGKRRNHNEIDKQEEYDEIDKYIEKAVTQKIEVPESFEKAMREALYSERFYKRLRKRKMIRAISTACATVILTSGVAVGGFIAYEKICKEPKQYTYEEFKNTIANSDVPDEDKESLISEEEAKKNALEIVNNLGYVGEEIESIELDKNNEEIIGKIYYVIKTNNQNGQQLNIRINAETGKLEALQDVNIFDTANNIQNISEDEAKRNSLDICRNINYEENDVVMTSCVEDIFNFDKEIKLWNTTFEKKYNDVVNPYEKLVIRFWIENNEMKIGSIFTQNNGRYDNNPRVISEDEAIEIAKNKEKEFTSNEIISIESELGIRKANKVIYELENNLRTSNIIESDENVYQQDIIIRNVWIIKINHEEELNTTVEDYLLGSDKQYYIDVTTGEIIGGKQGLEV